MSEEDRNSVIDMLRSPGWRIFLKNNAFDIAAYRRLATQPPSAVSEQDRTFLSGKADGREELINSVYSSVGLNLEDMV